MKSIKHRENWYPELWGSCYPRHYEISGIYPSPKELALVLFDAHMEWGSKAKYSADRQEMLKLNFASAFALVKLRVPIFFVAPDLLRSVQLSTPPVELDWTTFPLPFSSAAFALPRGEPVKHDAWRGRLHLVHAHCQR